MNLIRELLGVPIQDCVTERVPLHVALYFLSVSFRSLRFSASNEFVFLRDCFF